MQEQIADIMIQILGRAKGINRLEDVSFLSFGTVLICFEGRWLEEVELLL
jgi:hypothetical protein